MTTRDEIIAAALRLAESQGIGALSVRGVAKEAGVGATTLRHYFPSQPELHHAVAAQLVRGTLEDLGIADTSRDPATRLYECLVQFLPPEPSQAAALEGWFELYRLSLGPNPVAAVRGILESGHVSSVQALERWFDILAAQGYGRFEDVAANATYALALIDGLHLSMLLEPDRFTLGVATSTVKKLAEHLART